MELDALIREAEVADEIRMHIEECDRMYCEVHGCRVEEPECNVCKKLLSMGFHLTSCNLPEICIVHCERWRLSEDETQPTELPAGDFYTLRNGSWRGFGEERMNQALHSRL